MLDAGLGQELGQVFALLDARGTNQNRLTLSVTLCDVLNHHVELDLFVFEDQVGLV